ncbi:MAG: hypothetical protein ACOX1I_08630 [Dethiobacteria bacterium]
MGNDIDITFTDDADWRCGHYRHHRRRQCLNRRSVYGNRGQYQYCCWRIHRSR